VVEGGRDLERRRVRGAEQQQRRLHCRLHQDPARATRRARPREQHPSQRREGGQRGPLAGEAAALRHLPFRFRQEWAVVRETIRR
jgi:hypothetical protein